MPTVLDHRLRETLWRPYLEPIRVACRMREPEEDPALIVAVGLRETWLGTCPGYAPAGPNGRGDGGHGRGLFQIDDRGPWKHLIPPDGEDWPAYTQAQAACQVLAGAREELAAYRGALRPDVWETAVVCRYNASLASVRWALTEGVDPNQVTTQKNYGSDVRSLRDGLRSLFPGAFPAVSAVIV